MFKFNRETISDIIENALSLLVSFSMIIYGVGKIAQFKGTYSASANKVVSELTGQQLMWVFYDYSYQFALIIGVFEIIGAILISYKKTRLLGCIFTSFILCNIIIQDYIFDIIALKTAVFYQILILIIMWFNRRVIKNTYYSALIETKPLINKSKIIFFSLSLMLFALLKTIEFFVL